MKNHLGLKRDVLNSSLSTLQYLWWKDSVPTGTFDGVKGHTIATPDNPLYELLSQETKARVAVF